MDVSAKANIIASGFGSIENGKWRCSAVENTFNDGDFTTTIEVEAPETPKGLEEWGKAVLRCILD